MRTDHCATPGGAAGMLAFALVTWCTACTRSAPEPPISASPASGASGGRPDPIFGVRPADEPHAVATAGTTTLCAGSCTEVLASATGGTGEYEYSWDQGLPAGAGPYRVCPAESTQYTVTVRQLSGREIRGSQVSTATVTLDVLDGCSGSTPPGAGGSSPGGGAPGSSSSGGVPGSSGGAGMVPPSPGPDAGEGTGGRPTADDTPREARIACRAKLAMKAVAGGGQGQVVRNGANTYKASTVASDALGNMVVAGSFTGVLDTGAGTLDAHGAEWAAFVVKFDAGCRPLWAHTYGAPGARVDGGPVAVNSKGEIVLGGDVIPLPTNVDFGVGVTSGVEGKPNAFIVKLRPDGTTVFSNVYRSTEYSYVNGLAVDGADDIVLMGEASQGVSFGGPPIEGDSFGDYVAKLQSDGTHLWTRVGSTFSWFDEVHATRTGLVDLLGWARAGLDWGNGDVLGGAPESLFISQLDANGNHRLSRTVEPVAPSAWGSTFDVDSSEGTVVAYGHTSTTPQATTRALRALSVDGTWTAPVEWSVGAAATQAGWVRVDPTGGTVETGSLSAPAQIGSQLMTPMGGSDVYVVKRDATGQAVWSAQEGGADFDAPVGLATDSQGSAIVAFYAERDQPNDLFLVKYAP